MKNFTFCVLYITCLVRYVNQQMKTTKATEDLTQEALVLLIYQLPEYLYQ